MYPKIIDYVMKLRTITGTVLAVVRFRSSTVEGMGLISDLGNKISYA